MKLDGDINPSANVNHAESLNLVNEANPMSACLCPSSAADLNQPGLASLVGIDQGLMGNTPFISSSQKFYSDYPMFVSQQDLTTALDFTRLVSRLPQSNCYQEALGNNIPEIARTKAKNAGVLFGYDFHITANGPKLIEINTNAGGAYLNFHLLRAQVPCCDDVESLIQPALLSRDFEQQLMAMFQREFSLQDSTGSKKLSSIAIVDEEPETQFLYEEFLMFQTLFERNGIRTYIVDPKKLKHGKDGLYVGEERIDLIYNRHTDFYLETSSMALIKDAYLDEQVVLTPNPNHYGQLADKRLLTRFSDPHFLARLGLSSDEQALIQNTVPATVPVDSANAEDLWRNRRQYFFKPMVGFGSRASYSGAKLTKKTWRYILENNYVAQAFVPADVRRFNREGEWENYKTDLRVYSYEGKPLMIAARLYQGQTTNMRTPGGGFAPVFQFTAKAS